jgi:hypothetical protein
MGWMPNNAYKKNSDSDDGFKYKKKKKKGAAGLASPIKSMVDVNKKTTSLK